MQQLRQQLPTKPELPRQPIEYRNLIAEINRAQRSVNRSLAAGLDFGTLFIDDVVRAEQRLQRWFATDAGLEWQRVVREYNQRVREYGAALAASRQATLNAQERQKVRAAMCQKCFTVHRPEVECS